MGQVTTSKDIAEFLSTRRARLTPDQADLPTYGTNRRVPGLRREEVALLAGISVEYYTKLERGNATGISDSVLDALGRALRLDDAERSYLYHLVRAANTTPRRAVERRHPSRATVRRSLQLVLDGMDAAPAYVRNGRMDILAANDLGRALYSPMYAMAGHPPNTARFAFLDPAAPDFFRDWDTVEADSVAILRAAAGRDPYDRQLTDLIGELCTRSDRFRLLWARHDVKLHRSGTKRLHHPVVGDLTLGYEAFGLPADPGQQLNVYIAEPGSPAAHALALLASWTATAGVPAPTSGRAADVP